MQTIDTLFNEYYRGHLIIEARTHEERMKDFHRYWRPIKGKRASELTPMVIRHWLLEIAKASGNPTANKQRVMLRACLRWSAAQELASLPSGLFLAVKALPEKERVAYLHTGDEVARLRAALAYESPDIRDAIWLLLLTGQRKSNVLSMEWCELDLANAIWQIPQEKAKTNRTYQVPLTPKAVEILRHRQGKHPRWVFPSRNGKHLRAINKAWGRIRKRAGLGNLRIHDLRHTVGTWLAQSGASSFQIQRVLNHASVSTSQRYVHMAADNVRGLLAETQLNL